MANENTPLKYVPLLNKKGSAFLQAMIAIAITGIILYNLAPRIIDFKTQAHKNSNLISARLAVHSVLDYTLVGIKQKWCFSKAWTPESCGTNATQVSTNPRSVDRLLLTEEAVSYLQLLGVSNWATAKLEKIEHEFMVSDITTNNPVYKIFQNVDQRVKKIKVSIAIDNNATLPKYGDEVYLRVDVSLLDSSGEVVAIGASKLTATSYVGVYPREVGSFALILANNLYLDRASLGSSSKGDSFFKNFSAKTTALVSNGVVFNSPVFVNSDIYLPSSKESQSYTPVTFKEKVYIGACALKRDGMGFVPRSMGGAGNAFWSEIDQFGGFRGGIEVDGKKDLGLEYLSGSKTSSATSDSEMLKKCIANTAANSLLAATGNSDVMGDLVSSQNNDFAYLMKLTDYNKFTPQTGTLPQATSQKSGTAGLKLYDSSYKQATNGATLRYKLSIGNLSISGVIPDGGTAVLTTESNVQPLIDLYSNSIAQNNKSLADSENQLDRVNGKIKDQENDLDQIANSIKQERAKAVPDNTKIANLERNYDWVKDSLRDNKYRRQSYQNDISNLESKNIALQNSLDNAKSMNQKKATIELGMSRVFGKPGDSSTSNGSYRNMTLDTKNPEWLIDESGNKLNFSVEIEAFDVSYENFSSNRDAVTLSRNLNRGVLEIKWDGSNLVSSKVLRDIYGGSRGNMSSSDMYINYDEVCKTVDYSSFATVGWENSFAEVSKHSWSFTNTYDTRTNYIFNIDNASTAGGRVPAFVIRSIVKECIVDSSANFVTGFLNCEKLTILKRSTPLTIIGTFIVTGDISIDDSAYFAGIRWQSIYHPESTALLRNARVLKAVDGTSCNSLPRTPLWHPRPSLLNRVNTQQCNAMALRLKADPFRWTSVDPDCGLISSTSTATVCKNSLGNYFAMEVYRESGI